MGQSTNPKVSVIIPTYNRANLLPRAVNSVLAQTYQDYEIIIVDDCSPDNTQNVAAEFSDWRIRSVRHERNRGVSATRNTGIEYARGEYIAFLDDDDEWLPMKLKEQVEVIEASSEKVGLVYGWMDTIEDSSGRRFPETRNTMSGDISEDMLAMNFPATTSALLARTSAARQVGGFDESMAIYEDPDFIFRISERYLVEVLPKVVAMRHVEHGHGRLSDNTPESLSASSSVLRAHLDRFSDELSQRPGARSNVLRNLAAVEEMMRGNRLASMSAFLSSAKPAPVSRKILSHLGLLLKLFIWYATPLSCIRLRARAIRNRFRRGAVNHAR